MLKPFQREVLQLRTGIFQDYITRASRGEPLSSAMGWTLSFYHENPHLLSVWPAFA
jgi:hypothetical protein